MFLSLSLSISLSLHQGSSGMKYAPRQSSSDTRVEAASFLYHTRGVVEESTKLTTLSVMSSCSERRRPSTASEHHFPRSSSLPPCATELQPFFGTQKKTDHERGDRSHNKAMEATSFSELCRKTNRFLCEQNLESQFLGLWWQNSSPSAGIYRGCTVE
jgi:hypothetical protein